MDEVFIPNHWYWHVKENGRFWSSLLGKYGDLWEESRLTAIGTEQELQDVLNHYNLPGPIISPAEIKQEAQRRIILRVGATNLEECIIKQLNAQMRATELVNKRALGDTLTEQEEAEASALVSLAQDIKHIRSCSDIIEQTLPQDYKDDKYWP